MGGPTRRLSAPSRLVEIRASRGSFGTKPQFRPSQNLMRCDAVTPSASAIRPTFTNDPLRSPRSTPPMQIRPNPQRSANSSCDHCRFVRSSRTRLPNAAGGAFAIGIDTMNGQRIYGPDAFWCTDYECYSMSWCGKLTYDVERQIEGGVTKDGSQTQTHKGTTGQNLLG